MKRNPRRAPPRTSFNLSEGMAGRIREPRRARGWSQTQMAKEAGLSDDGVSRIERGDRKPRLATLELIAAALGLSLPTVVGQKTIPRPRSMIVARAFYSACWMSSTLGWTR
jgi:transcriptional regulator with XRE-family HTH domain